jgi:hypothetical protein
LTILNSNGNVGIGTASPGYKLDVNGGSDTTVARFYNSGTTSTIIRLGDTGNSQYSEFIWDADTSVASIFKAGTGYSAYGGANSFNIYNQTGAIAFHPNNISNAMFIASSGNVGIGTASPTRRLQIGNFSSTSTATPETFSLGATFSNTAGSNPKIRVWEDGTYSMGFGVSSNQLDYILGRTIYRHVFYAEGNHLMTILGTGNVGIGTTTPSAKLEVNGNGQFANTLYLTEGSPIGGFGLNIGDIRISSVNTTNSDFVIFNLGTTEGTGAIRFSDSPNYDYDEWAGLEYHRNGRLMLGGPRMFTNNGTPDSVRELVLAASSSVDFVITGSSGFVGIGMSSPLSRLHVAGDIRASLSNVSQANLVAYNTSTGLFTYLSTSSFAAVNIYNSDGTLTTDRTVDNDTNNLTFINVQNFALQTLPNNETSEVVYYDSTNGKLSYGGTPATTPAGSTTQVQFNNAGAFGADAGFVYSGSRVGIGVTNPLATLEVVGTTYLRITLFTDTIRPYTADQLTLLNGGNNRLYVNGNVGIGTASPSTHLHVYSSDTTYAKIQAGGGAYSYLQLETPSSGNGYLIKNIATANSVLDKSLYLWNDPGPIQFVPNGTVANAVTISTGGNVGIGTATPLSKLHVNGDIRASLSNVNQSNFVAYNSSTGLFTYAGTGSIVIGTATNADNVYINEDATDANQPVLFAELVNEYQPVRGNNNFNYNPATDTLTAGTYVESSALKFKENVIHLTGSLQDVEKLQGVTYNKIGQTRKEIGLIADEVVKILPELVKYQDGEVYGLSYNRLTAVLVEAVKELSDKVKQQEIFIQDLADRLKKQEDKG